MSNMEAAPPEVIWYAGVSVDTGARWRQPSPAKNHHLHQE